MLAPLLTSLLLLQQPRPTRLFQTVSQLKEVCLATPSDPDLGGKFAACAFYSLGVIDSWLAVRWKLGFPPCFNALPDKLDVIVLIQVGLEHSAPEKAERAAAAFVLDTFLEKYPQCGTAIISAPVGPR